MQIIGDEVYDGEQAFAMKRKPTMPLVPAQNSKMYFYLSWLGGNKVWGYWYVVLEYDAAVPKENRKISLKCFVGEIFVIVIPKGRTFEIVE